MANTPPSGKGSRTKPVTLGPPALVPELSNTTMQPPSPPSPTSSGATEASSGLRMIVVRNGVYGRAVKVTKTPGELTVRSLTPATWDTAGRRITASFLYNATRSLFEEAGFSYSRPKGMNHCVMTATVAPAGH